MPNGLLSRRYRCDSAARVPTPSTAIRARVSTLVPSVVTTTPFTATRPAAMSSSAPRRDATPRAASTFCSRSSLTAADHFGGTRGKLLDESLRGQDARQLVEAGEPEALEKLPRGPVFDR